MAGLYIKELQLRRAADRVLIVAPANLRPQWQRELAERFDIDCVQMDRALFDSSPTQNPWDLHDFIIVSRDFMKAEGIIDSFVAAEQAIGTSASSTRPTASRCTSTARAHQQEERPVQGGGEDRRKAHRLILLTATPHSGKIRVLWGLLRLLDPDAYGDRCPRKSS